MHSVKLSLFFLILFGFNLEILAQNTIQGSVTDIDSIPLVGANVVLQGTNLGTAANSNGEFTLTNIPDGNHTLVISYIGFQRQRITFHTDNIASISFDVKLRGSVDMPQIEIIGQSPDSFERIPGSATVISGETLQRINPVSTSDVFRFVPGLNIVDQDPLGLRANIGIRGLDPSASRNVLMLEDGIPVALAPYGEPEMYYTPAMNRMKGVEIIKGSGSILFGPQTFGGVINYTTANPPAESSGDVHLRGGEGGYFVGRATLGNTVGKSGYLITYLNKSGNEVGYLDYDIHDLSGKFKFVLGDQSLLGLKLGFYNEESNSTYVGLTQQMYDSGEFDFYDLGETDGLSIRRYSASLTHDYFFSEDFRLRTTAFGYTTTRNWSREDFDNTFNPNRNYPRIVGDPTIDGGAIFFRGTTGNRNRSFEVAGIEPRFTYNFQLSGLQNEMDFGARFLYERAFEQRINGVVSSPTTGDLRDDEIRTGYATSGYVQNKTYVTNEFTITPGLRIEHFVYDREILRLGFENVGSTTRDEVTTIIPGLGFNYLLGDHTSIYAGVHRGFGPPRVKDAISATGVS